MILWLYAAYFLANKHVLEKFAFLDFMLFLSCIGLKFLLILSPVVIKLSRFVRRAIAKAAIVARIEDKNLLIAPERTIESILIDILDFEALGRVEQLLVDGRAEKWNNFVLLHNLLNRAVEVRRLAVK